MNGIYKIICITNKKFYIGSSCNLKKREREHFKSLKTNKHANIKLQRAFNKYGINNFLFIVIEIVEKREHLLEREQYFIDKEKPFFNICKIANSSLGIKRRIETRNKVRDANLGLKHPKWRNEIKSKAQSGQNHWTKTKKFSKESRKKMSESHKLRYKNGAISPFKNRVWSKEKIDSQIKAVSKPVIQFSINGDIIKEWPSAAVASREGFNACCISRCCRGIQNNHKNFTWEYK